MLDLETVVKIVGGVGSLIKIYEFLSLRVHKKIYSYTDFVCGNKYFM